MYGWWNASCFDQKLFVLEQRICFLWAAAFRFTITQRMPLIIDQRIEVSELRRGAAASLSESSVASRFTITHGMSKVIDQDLQVSDLEWRRVLVMFLSTDKLEKRLRWAAAAICKSIWEQDCCKNNFYYQVWNSSDHWPKKHKCLTLRVVYVWEQYTGFTIKHGTPLIIEQRNTSVWLWAVSITHWAAAASCKSVWGRWAVTEPPPHTLWH